MNSYIKENKLIIEIPVESFETEAAALWAADNICGLMEDRYDYDSILENLVYECNREYKESILTEEQKSERDRIFKEVIASINYHKSPFEAERLEILKNQPPPTTEDLFNKELFLKNLNGDSM